MAYEVEQIESVTAFIDRLATLPQGVDTWYRGQARREWKLIPSLVRDPDSTEQERNLMKRFQQTTRPLISTVPKGEDTWEWLFLMQHHNVHTRLLDWTESPLVALFFAVKDKADPEDHHDGAVWMLDPHKLNAHANHDFHDPTELPAFGVDGLLDSYLPDRIVKAANMKPVAAIGPRTSSRMAAQLGTFTITHSVPIPIEEVEDGSHIRLFVVPASAKKCIREVLNVLQYNDLRLFPDLDRAAAVAMKVRRSE